MGKRAPEQTEKHRTEEGQIPEWQPLLLRVGGRIRSLFSDAQWLNNRQSFQYLRQT